MEKNIIVGSSFLTETFGGYEIRFTDFPSIIALVIIILQDFSLGITHMFLLDGGLYALC